MIMPLYLIAIIYLAGGLIIAMYVHVSSLVKQMKKDKKTNEVNDNLVAIIVFWPLILFCLPFLLTAFCIWEIFEYIGKVYNYLIKKLAVKIVGKAVVLTSPDPEIRKLAE